MLQIPINIKRLAVLFACAVLAFSASAGAQRGAVSGEWRHYGGDAWGTKYSPLDQRPRFLPRAVVRDETIEFVSPEVRRAAVGIIIDAGKTNARIHGHRTRPQAEIEILGLI